METIQRENKMGVQPIPSLLIKMSLPMMASMLVMALYNIVDSIFVSRISENALTAVSLVYPFQMLFISVAVGTGVGVNSLIARRLGERRQADADTAASTGQFLALVSALVFMFVYAVFPRQLLASFADDAEILDLATTYLRLCGGLCGFAIFATMAENTIQATGDTIRPMLIQLAGAIFNIVFDPILIFGYFGFPAMGVAGAAWATILSQFLSAVFSTVVGLRNFPILHLRREDFHDLKGAAVLHLKTGFPMGFQMSVMCIGQLAMQAVVNSLGTAAVAGYTAASKADQLSVLVNNAMMTAISNYVAQNFGAGKKDRIRLGVRASLIQTEAFNILMCIGILLLRHPIVELFLSNPTAEIYHYSDAFLTIEAPFYFLLGLLAVYRTSIQSMQNGRAPFAACMIELVMRLAATVWLSRFLGYTAVCIASPLAWFGAIALLIPVYYRMMMKPVKTV